MLDKLTGVLAPRPSTSPHKVRECLPLKIFLRNRLKHAPTGDKVKICTQWFIKIHGPRAKYKLCGMRKIFVGTKGIPHPLIHNAPTICSLGPLSKVNSTTQIDLETGKITSVIQFDTGNLGMVTGGANLGRIDVITRRETSWLFGCDANGNTFANLAVQHFYYWQTPPWISLNQGKNVHLTIAQERKRLVAKQSSG
ncbi:hypothetical protein HPG69_010198 [Diceros bicornis minor]|uniref:Small ribosomal subunit protein eS4 central region domain-containing protein n=1 Tax=Diceros bicornis minor TaxID=77932 RepID=A0A7J7EE56_DICBM|nr:hypothetical protein HPG69_010198 [Diceros bicornis minor]